MVQIEKIGENAGTVWNLLNKYPNISMRGIHTNTGLTPNEIAASLGWLSREGKLKEVKHKNVRVFSVTY